MPFQSTPPHRWRHYILLIPVYKDSFNPLHHTGGDGADILKEEARRSFNPLHHTGGDFGDFRSFPSLSIFQSTPPHRWRLSRQHMGGPDNFLSIHSTTQVETSLMVDLMAGKQLSIHSTTQVETIQ